MKTKSKTVATIKQAELTHGKAMVDFFGPKKSTKIIGSYHAVRRIKKLDHELSLDMLFDANEKLENALVQTS